MHLHVLVARDRAGIKLVLDSSVYFSCVFFLCVFAFTFLSFVMQFIVWGLESSYARFTLVFNASGPSALEFLGYDFRHTHWAQLPNPSDLCQQAVLVGSHACAARIIDWTHYGR